MGKMGSGIAYLYSGGSISNCLINNNLGEAGGAGVYTYASNVDIHNCVI